jgi:hypothetical protein
MSDLTDNNPKSRYGDKKAPVHLFPPIAMLKAAEVFRLGAAKYGPYNWRDDSVSATVYYSAAMRHLASWFDGEDIDPESGQSHLAHVLCCMSILLDAESIGKMIDNRPVNGCSASWIREQQK